MLTVIGSVGYRNAEPLGHFDLRHFELQTSVYDPPKTAPLDFSLICYFSSGKRWEKVKVPNTGSYVSVTAKVVGRTTKDNRLAVRVLDMSYIPQSFSTPVSSPASTQSTSSKRPNRWCGRVESVTPSKKTRYSAPEMQSPRTPPAIEAELDQQLSSTITQHLNNVTSKDHPPALTPIDDEFDGGGRPQRNRRPPKKNYVI